MKIRKVVVYYGKNGMPISAMVTYKNISTQRVYEGTFPMTVTDFILTAAECKTYYTTGGCKFDVYTA